MVVLKKYLKNCALTLLDFITEPQEGSFVSNNVNDDLFRLDEFCTWSMCVVDEKCRGWDRRESKCWHPVEMSHAPQYISFLSWTLQSFVRTSEWVAFDCVIIETSLDKRNWNACKASAINLSHPKATVTFSHLKPLIHIHRWSVAAFTITESTEEDCFSRHEPRLNNPPVCNPPTFVNAGSKDPDFPPIQSPQGGASWARGTNTNATYVTEHHIMRDTNNGYRMTCVPTASSIRMSSTRYTSK